MAVAVALVREDGRERLEFACAPEVKMEQGVEELLFRAYSLYRQVQLTFEAGRDRSLLIHMTYGVIAGIFKELDRAAALKQAECSRIAYLETACVACRALLPRASPAPRAAALPRRA